MLKRIILFAFLLTMLGLLAFAPMNMNQAPETNAKYQATVIATVVVASPVIPGATSPAVDDMSSSMIIIIGLLIVLGIGVVVGGAALMSRRRE